MKMPRTYAEAVDEGKRITEEPTWVRIGRLAEYVSRTWLQELSQRGAVDQYLNDVGIRAKEVTVRNWIPAAHVWDKTAPNVRRDHPAQIYYVEAARSQRYRKKEVGATRAVLHQVHRRRERSFVAYTDQVVCLANVIDRDEAKLTWITPERAEQVLAQLPLIARFLRKVAARKRSAA
jgi:hypothetical protein